MAAPIMEREAQYRSISIGRDLPVHQDAARCGAGHIQDGRTGRHLNHQLIGDLIASHAIVDLARVIAVVDHLQIRQHQIPGIQELRIVCNALAKNAIVFVPFAARLSHGHARQRHR